MKTKILTMTAILVVILALTGIASANGVGSGCPDRNSLGSHTQTYDFLSANEAVNGNVLTYSLDTVNKAGASVIAYCVYPTPVFTGSDSDLTPLYVGNVGLWTIFHPDSKDFFGFTRGSGGDNNNIPIDGTTGIDVGKTDYLSADKKPTSEVVLFHIKDSEECARDDDSEEDSDTCWRRPGTPQPPIPELSTIVLTTAGIGILGLFLVLRKRNKN